MNKKRIVSNLLVVGSGQVTTWAVSVVYLVLLSRYLGPRELGQLTLAGAVASILGLLVQLGMDIYITQNVAREPNRTPAVISTAFLVRAILSISTPLVLFVYGFLAHVDAQTRTATYILCGSMILNSFSGILLAVFQGKELMSVGAVGGVIHNVLTLLLGVVVIMLHGGIVAFAGVAVVVEASLLGIYIFLALRVTPIKSSVTLQGVRELVSGSLAFWANNLFMTFYIFVDSVILSSLADSRAVGFYAPPTRVFAVALFVPSIVASVTLPVLSRLGLDAGQDFIRAGRKTLCFLIACSIPLTIGLISFAGPMITFVFGPEYGPSVPVLMILALCIPCTFFNIEISYLLGAQGRQLRWTIIMSASCVVNPATNLLLIPFAAHHWHNAALGAAVALLCTELLMSVYGVAALREVVWDISLGRALVSALVAGLIQGMLIRLLGSPWIIPAEALAVLNYAFLAVVTGLVSMEELQLVGDTVVMKIRRSPAGSVGQPAG